jgi:hypothetical protein
VLFSPNPFPDQPSSLRYRCRNRHLCGGCKLAEPAERAIDAFCCRGCYDGFFRKRCRVCERPFERRNDRQQICDRRKCRNAFRADRASFFSSRYVDAPDVVGDLETSTKQGVKSALAWLVVAGPAVSEANLLPPDSETAGRMARASAEFQKTFRRAGAAALFQRGTPPANVLGGEHFAGAPVVELAAPVDESAGDITTAAAAAALIATIPDDLSIPAFHRRGRTS